MVLRDGVVVSTGPKAEFTVDKMVSQMVGRDIDQMYPPRKSEPSQQVALEVRGLSQSGIVGDISFELHKGEVLGADQEHFSR